MQLSVIIVNYNVKYFLEQCLHSVSRAAEGIETEIFVVDNNSADGSKDYLEPLFPYVKFIWNDKNLGFGKANNIALKSATGDHVLFLNPDCILPEDCFTKCLRFFKLHEDCGALGVRMIDGSGRFLKESKRSFPSARASMYKVSGLAKLFHRSKTFAAYYAGNLDEHKTNLVEVLAGAFLMISKRMAIETEGFDERFFMYAEDIDLSYRIIKAGKRNYYFPEICIIHFKGESTQRLSNFYLEHFYGAMELFAEKHYRGQLKRLQFSKMAIRITKQLTKISMKLQSKLANKNSQETVKHTVIICRQQSFNAMIGLLKFSKEAYILLGRIASDDNDMHNSIGTVAQLPEIIGSKNISQIVFCEESIPYKAAIKLIQQLPSSLLYLFHAKGSNSMAGSNNRKAQGCFIAFPAGAAGTAP